MDLRARLLALRPARPRPQPPAAPPPVHPTRLPGEEIRTPAGAFQRVTVRYPLHAIPLGAQLLAQLAEPHPLAAQLARHATAPLPLRGLAFVDIETTGLAGGAGTLAFLIGVGVFEADTFVLHQYFLRNPAEELAALTHLEPLLQAAVGWVSFNGLSFDMPALETRYILYRQRDLAHALRNRPHLDLLLPARRLYHGRLPSCALSALERDLFDLHRDQADVPGELIPQMYVEYLRTGDPADMARVLYHNATDILSLVTLLAHLLRIFADPTDPADLVRVARWHDEADRPAEAEALYHRALRARLTLDDRALALQKLAALYKRQNRRAEAVPLWEQWASFAATDPLPFVELAKFYEWHAPDLPAALRWAEKALAVCRAQAASPQQAAAIAQTEHRLERVRHKLIHGV